MRLESMEAVGNNSSITAQIGAATSVSSGAIVIFGQSLTQIEMALGSMLIGAIVGIGGLIASVTFKWLSHKEECRRNDIEISLLRKKYEADA